MMTRRDKSMTTYFRVLGWVIGIGIGWMGQAEALSQFALLTGNRCINCHVSTQGGAQRDELGQYSMDGVGMLAPNYVLPGKTAFADGLLLLGADVRGQMARSHISPDAARKVFPMQVALYGVVRPSNAFKVEGTYNFGPEKYDGQRAWTASAIYQPNYDWPAVRVGHFQPSIGMRYDDHTMLVRQTPHVAGYSSLIAPNYAEYGAEVHYYKYLWLSLTAGIHRAHALAENTVRDAQGALVSLIADRDKPSFLGRVVLWPRWVEQKINFYVGGSWLKNGDFAMTNLFAGMGIQDMLAVMVEYALADKDDLRETKTASLDVSFQARPGLLFFARGERGATVRATELTTRQAVFGIQMFLTPQIELRPEYRILDTETFRSSRYALQLHVFY